MASDQNPKVRHWVDIAKKRLLSILGRHTIATARTLESKISNAGPYNQRVESVHLTTARRELKREGRINTIMHLNRPWYHLDDARPDTVQERLDEQGVVYKKISGGSISMLIGQALEIAVYRSLDSQTELDFYGGFPELDAHDDSTLYTKVEPPSLVSGLRLPGDQKLDFLLRHIDAGHAGIEVKNVREWFYPDRKEVRDHLNKCCSINAVPVLIARRIPYVTFTEVFKPCGVIIHETLNQRFPDSKKRSSRPGS